MKRWVLITPDFQLIGTGDISGILRVSQMMQR